MDQFDQNRIRELRQNLNMTQENFAHEIGVTFATVNRWENGRTQPNKVAQKILKQLERKLRRMQRQ
jgi:putative transcriptional regulator